MLIQRILIILCMTVLVLSVSGCPNQNKKSGKSFKNVHNKMKSNVKRVGNKADRDMRRLDRKIERDTSN